MAEYIEREALISALRAYQYPYGVEFLVSIQPAADVVEVVRCKDCKHNVANWKHDELDATDYTDIVCDYFMTDGMCPDDFCSYGERKETE